jgi:hypothetical protein
MSLKVQCRHKPGCEEVVTVDEFARGVPGAGLRKPKADTPQRVVLYIECPEGHLERYEVDIHPDGTVTLPTE